MSNNSNSRRRSNNNNNNTEEEPLVLEMSRNYWTFHNKHKQRKHPYYSYSSDIPSRSYSSYSSYSYYYSWQWILFALILVGGGALLFGNHHPGRAGDRTSSSSSANTLHRPEHSKPNNTARMIWDYNAYHRSSGSSRTTSFSSLLLAQHDDTERTVDITSVPNRAYARQRGLDYVRFPGGTLRDFLLLLQSSYDSIAFFPSNAVLIHLDHSLQELLPTPPDQFMTVGNATGFFVLNLRHAYAPQAISQWQRLRNEEEDDDVLSSLRSFLLFLVSDPHLAISYLPEHDGFVGTNRLLHCIPRHESQSMEEYQMALSTTVASVCYRYYPKCEVL